MRWLVVIAVVLATTRADAAMMQHYDLAGLILQSDAIVVAQRGVSTGDTTHYQILRTLRGSFTGTAVDVYDRTYVADGADTRVVLFLATRDGTTRIVQSGLRVTKANLVFRFEQHSNPGPYVMVPQGADPQDNWGDSGAQLDVAGLERAIAAAGRRVDALAAARSERDPTKRRAAILALFAPGPTASPAWGFYSDLLAQEAKTVLATAGDLEGALLVDLRDRSRHVFDDFAEVGKLVAVATDPKATIALRVAAITAIERHRDLYKSFDAIRAMIKLVDDPSPLVRAAAIEAAARPAQVQTSETAIQRTLNAIVGEARTAIAKRYATEPDNAVVFAIAVAFESFRKPLPARAGGPAIAAQARVTGDFVRVEVRCLRKVSAPTIGKVTATANGTATSINTSLSFCGSAGTGSSADHRPAAGTYQLTVTIDSKPAITLPLGSLVVTATTMALAP
ncbi:MAG: hypothetical protein ABI867_15850 [Kofleriaceae bacterium]